VRVSRGCTYQAHGIHYRRKSAAFAPPTGFQPSVVLCVTRLDFASLAIAAWDGGREQRGAALFRCFREDVSVPRNPDPASRSAFSSSLPRRGLSDRLMFLRLIVRSHRRPACGTTICAHGPVHGVRCGWSIPPTQRGHNGTGLSIKPCQVSRHDCMASSRSVSITTRQRRARVADFFFSVTQKGLARMGQAKGDCFLARPVLGRYQKVASTMIGIGGPPLWTGVSDIIALGRQARLRWFGSRDCLSEKNVALIRDRRCDERNRYARSRTCVCAPSPYESVMTRMYISFVRRTGSERPIAPAGLSFRR